MLIVLPLSLALLSPWSQNTRLGEMEWNGEGTKSLTESYLPLSFVLRVVVENSHI